MVSFSWCHGLGDTANFVFLCKYYTERGHALAVQTDPTKRCLFEAAGCTLTNAPKTAHGYPHPPEADTAQPGTPWHGNKCAWNISRAPLPDVGGCAAVWDDLCRVEVRLDHLVTADVRARIDPLVDRDTILFHPQGNTGPADKNLTHVQQRELLTELLDRTDARIVLLDWDNRVARLENRRIRHLADLGCWSTLELYHAIERAGLLIGVDSGVLHFTRLTRTPAVGLWTRHLPSHYALPRAQTVHVSQPCPVNTARRLDYQIVDNIPLEAVCAQAFTQGPKTVFQDSLLRRTRNQVKGQPVDRQRSFALLRQLAPGADWLEVGCIREAEDWSAGYSTYLFTALGVRLTSVDTNPANLAFARRVCGPGLTTVHATGEAHLRATMDTYDAIYLDGADADTPDGALCTRREAEALLPRLSPGGLVLIDDCARPDGGKGRLAVPFLLQNGFRIVYEGYQVLLRRD